MNMKKLERYYQPLPWLSALLLTALLAGCGGGGKDPILGSGGAVQVPPSTTPTVPDTTRPRVSSTVPVTTTPGPTPNVASNAAVTAVFSEAMAPASITAPGTFTLSCASPCVAPSGTVTYDVASRTAIYRPSPALANTTTYTATITTAATDLAGNALAGNQAPLPAASNYVWTFTTSVPDTTQPTITLENPVDNATNIALNNPVNATFSEPMDPTTLTTANFLLQESGPPIGSPLTGTVTYDPLTYIATFTPASVLLANTTYTATITGAKDLAGNSLAPGSVPNPWVFTTGTGLAPGAVSLGSASAFGNLGGTAGTTNQGIYTVINGDIGTTATTTSSVTGFHDSQDIYTETGSNIGTVNGSIYTCTISTTGPTSVTPNPASCLIATNALHDAQTAYNNLTPALMPGGTDPGAGQLGGLTLAPGIYKSASGTFQITGSDLTLDGQGNANAVWVFQMASTLTVGGPGLPMSVKLINGAQAKNVFWQVGSSAIINAAGGGTMVGNILAHDSVAFSTAGNAALVTLDGRAVGLNASLTMTNTVINVPAP